MQGHDATTGALGHHGLTLPSMTPCCPVVHACPGGYMGKRATKGCSRTPVMQKLLRAVAAQKRLVIPDEVGHGSPWGWCVCVCVCVCVGCACPPAPPSSQAAGPTPTACLTCPPLPCQPQYLSSKMCSIHECRMEPTSSRGFTCKQCGFEVNRYAVQRGSCAKPEVPTEGRPSRCPSSPAPFVPHPRAHKPALRAPALPGTLQGHQRQRQRPQSVPPAREGRHAPCLPPAPQALVQGLLGSGSGGRRQYPSSGRWHHWPRCAWLPLEG